MLRISDFPREKYAGYFEIIEAYHNTKAEVDKLAENAKFLNSEGLERLIKLRKELEKYKPGDHIVRVYSRGEEASVLEIEAVLQEPAIEDFVREHMAELEI